MSLPDPWRYPRPDTAAHYIGLLADAPRRPLAIFGPRQVGKTHFLTHDLLQACQNKGWEPVYVDLWGQADPLGAVNTAMGSLLRRLDLSAGRTAVTSVGALGLQLGMAAPAALPQGGDPAEVLAARFAEVMRLQPGKPVLLLLDEAQTLVKPGAGDLAMKAIRALFNSHPGNLLLLFTGSSKSQLLALVGDHSKTAFKLAAHMDFPLLGSAFCAHVARRHEEITQRSLALVDVDWAFSQLLHRPGEMIDFVRFMITDAVGLDLKSALVAFKAKNQPDMALQQQFEACTPAQRAVLLEVAGGPKLFSREARERVARRLGQPAAMAPASMHNTLQQLEERGLLVKSQARGAYEFDDEQLRDWVDRVARQGSAHTLR